MGPSAMPPNPRDRPAGNWRCDLRAQPHPSAAWLLEQLAPQVEVRVELPRWSFVKRSPNGSIEYVSPLPCPFSYGEVQGTRSGDGEAIDALILGPSWPSGALIVAQVIAIADFVDGGVADPKVVVRPGNARRGLSPAERRRILAFFALWVPYKKFLARLQPDSGVTAWRGLLECQALEKNG